MATVLEIAQDAAVLIGITPPASLTQAATGYDALLRVCLNHTGKELALMRDGFYKPWPSQLRTHEFTTLEGVSDYPVPPDFVSLIESTAWERHTIFDSIGPLTPRSWATFRENLVVTPYPAYRIQVVQQGTEQVFAYRLAPPQGEGRTFIFEYASSSWLKETDTGFPTKDKITSDDDIPIHPEDLLQLGIAWRFKKARNEMFQDDLGEYETLRDKYFFEAITPKTGLTLGQRRDDEDAFPFGNIPYTVVLDR